MVNEKELEPPAYDTLVLSKSGQRASQDTSRNQSGSRSQPTTPSSSSFFHFQPLPSSPLSASSASSSSSGWSTWIPWSSSQKTYNELQVNVRRLIRQMVVGIGEQQPGEPETASMADAAAGILQSCADACAKHGVSLKSILQEKYIEGHSPLYWAIVKLSSARPSERQEAEVGAVPDAPDVLGVLLSYSLPLKPSAISELRHACLSVSDQNTFQRLRLLAPNFSTMSGADRILLGASLSSDVDVTTIGSENNNNDGAFAVTMQFPQFHKRLMVSREVGVEFVARNRIWRFSFAFIKEDWEYRGPRAGCWCATLCLPYNDSSPSTWFDGRLTLINPRQEREARREEASSSSSRSVANPDEIVYIGSSSKERLEPSYEKSKQIAVSLEDSPAFASLQYAESSYLPADGKLTVWLEARLVKPDKNRSPF